MTPAQRETLREMLIGHAIMSDPESGKKADALRAALVERTCGTCALGDRDRNGIYCQRLAEYVPSSDGCIKGWSPREDAPEDAR